MVVAQDLLQGIDMSVKWITAALAGLVLAACSGQPKNEVAVIETSLGTMVVSLDSATAPNTVAHFKGFVEKGWYDDKTFYRVVPDFVIQGGDGKEENDEPTVAGEFNGKHLKGTISMARGTNPDSASTEIFICLADVPRLDGKYAAFGQVVEGMDVLEAIGQVELIEKYIDYEGKSIAFHTPAEKVVIHRIRLDRR